MPVVVAADATAPLAGLQLNHAAHPLQLVVVGVQQLEVEHLAGRGEEVRRAVLGDRDRAERRLGHVAGPAAASRTRYSPGSTSVTSLGQLWLVRKECGSGALGVRVA